MIPIILIIPTKTIKTIIIIIIVRKINNITLMMINRISVMIKIIIFIKRE